MPFPRSVGVAAAAAAAAAAVGWRLRWLAVADSEGPTGVRLTLAGLPSRRVGGKQPSVVPTASNRFVALQVC